MKKIRLPWNSMENSMEFHGIPWNSMEISGISHGIFHGKFNELTERFSPGQGVFVPP
jgi:hypothetical protein